MKDRILMDYLERVEAEMLAMRFIPDGADLGLPRIPAEIEVSEDDLDGASELWDLANPELAGLLDAEVTNQRR